MDIASFLNQVDAFVWGPVMICLLLGTHVFLTIRTGFIQRKLPLAIKLSVQRDDEGEGDVSQFGALVTALAGTIGTGSIVGVATAIIAGGPGAVFWMWLTGVFGIATKYTEVYAAIKYRVKDHRGQMLGGAMYAWERAFKRPDGSVPFWAKLGAVLFAAFAVVATLGTGSAVQSSAMTGIICGNFPMIPKWAVSLVIAVFVAVVIFGGVKSITSVCERLVPFMAAAYTIGCLIILVSNAPYLGQTLSLILECAFTSKAAFGGAVGSGIMIALQYGCARGLFSNESGLGTAPIVAAAASTRNPARQALIASTGTFWSTVVICLITGLVLVSTMLAHPDIVMDGSLQAGECRLCHHSLRRHTGARHRHGELCLFDDSGMELLREPLRHLSLRQASDRPLSDHLRRRGNPRRIGCRRYRLDRFRYRKRAHGPTQHHHDPLALGHDSTRN